MRNPKVKCLEIGGLTRALLLATGPASRLVAPALMLLSVATFASARECESWGTYDCPQSRYLAIRTAADVEKSLRTVDQLDGWIRAWKLGRDGTPTINWQFLKDDQEPWNQNVWLFVNLDPVGSTVVEWDELASLGYASPRPDPALGRPLPLPPSNDVPEVLSSDWSSVVKGTQTLSSGNFEDRWILFDDMIAIAERKEAAYVQADEKEMRAAPLPKLWEANFMLQITKEGRESVLRLKEFRGAMKAVENKYKALALHKSAPPAFDAEKLVPSNLSFDSGPR